MAVNVIAPLCEQYFKYAVWAKVTTKPIGTMRGSDSPYHKAGFTATVASLDNPKAVEKMKVACKVYNEDRQENVVYIKYEDIVNGYYNLFATIIMGTCYYLDFSSIIAYQQEMGNSCARRLKGHDYIVIDGDYWMNEARYEAEMNDADKAKYK